MVEVRFDCQPHSGEPRQIPVVDVPSPAKNLVDVGRVAVVSVTTAWADVGKGASAATDRMCQTPSTGSVTVRTSMPAPVEVSSGDPGPWSAALGLMAKMSKSVGTLLVQVYVMVSLAVIVW